MNKATPKEIYAIKFGAIIIVMAIYCFVPQVHNFVTGGIGYIKAHDFEGLRQFVLSFGLWAPVATITLMALQSTTPLVPGVALTIINAWIFGWAYGALYSWLGALLGALLDFAIARFYGRPIIKSLISDRYLVLADSFFQQYGALAIFITRLTPVIPFKVISYTGGLTNISALQFSLATGIGQTPAIILYSILGHNLPGSFYTSVVITIVSIFLGFIFYLYRDKIKHCFFPDKEQ